MLIMGEAIHVLGQAVYGNPVHTSQFWCEPETSLESKVYLRMKKKLQNHIFKIFQEMVNLPRLTGNVHKFNK